MGSADGDRRPPWHSLVVRRAKDGLSVKSVKGAYHAVKEFLFSEKYPQVDPEPRSKRHRRSKGQQLVLVENLTSLRKRRGADPGLFSAPWRSGSWMRSAGRDAKKSGPVTGRNARRFWRRHRSAIDDVSACYRCGGSDQKRGGSLVSAEFNPRSRRASTEDRDPNKKP